MKPVLTDSDFAAMAEFLQCDIPAIKAVCTIEAPKGGFNPDGTPVTLFEGHHFHHLTDGMYDHTFPTLSHPQRTKLFYGKSWQQEQRRLQQAKSINLNAALKSASWGRFQIMGFNFRVAGCPTIEKFVAMNEADEQSQADLFIHFLQYTKLDAPLRRHQWTTFAKGYNGKEQVDYDTRIANAFKRLGGK